MRTDELEERLREWGDEYGGSRYDNVGWPPTSGMAQLIKYHGKSPDNLNPRATFGTKADEVETIVRDLASQGGKFRAAILRTEYWMRNAAMEHKLQRLRERDGVIVNEIDYERLLHSARIFVADGLGLRVASGDPRTA